VILYNPATQKQDWHTVNGTKRDAEAFERRQKTRQASGVYIAKSERRTFAEVAAMFLKERRARNRRAGTVTCYENCIDRWLLPTFGSREVGTIRRSDIASFFDDMREGRLKDRPPATVQTVNRALRCLKATLYLAVERELVERNVMQRFRPYEGGKSERHVKRGAFSEAQIQALLGAAKPEERAAIALMCFTGMRPGEMFALDWECVDLEAGSLSVARSWDSRSQQFVPPKTKAGERTIPLSGWLVAELTAHKVRTGGQGLVFANGAGRPFGTSNFRRDVWLPLRERAKVPALDLYSLRATFATLGRTSGESAFSVGRMMGHTRSTLVDQVYARSMMSGLASVAESVTARALGTKPQLRLIEGGQRDVRETLDETLRQGTRPSQVVD
jgi:integrase